MMPSKRAAALVALILIAYLESSTAKSIKINWTIPPQISDAGYNAGSATLAACVGDVLKFSWSTAPVRHSLATTSSASWSSCKMSGAKLVKGTKMATSGRKNVAIKKAGTAYYVCTVPGHCQAGHKLKVVAKKCKAMG